MPRRKIGSCRCASAMNAHGLIASEEIQKLRCPQRQRLQVRLLQQARRPSNHTVGVVGLGTLQHRAAGSSGRKFATPGSGVRLKLVHLAQEMGTCRR